MEIHYLNSVRLGFSTYEAEKISSEGVNKFVSKQLNSKNEIKEPHFIAETPRNLKELKSFKDKIENGQNNVEKIGKYLAEIDFEWKAFLLERFYTSQNPLREKINLFFQNHFVSTSRTVKIPYWIFVHYKTINDFSMGNYKTLVKEMIYSNAMIKYLDNQQNKKGKINENLGRELLELFTLGEGNYTEIDIKNAALSLAGLTFGDEKGMYRPFLKDNSVKTFMGKSGNFDANDIVDIIFEQKNTPYFLAEKVLKWFFYDNPDKTLILKYGDVLKKNNFELSPFFQILFTDECAKKASGTQIKNPLQFIFQIFRDLNIRPNYKLIAFFLKNQGMDIYDQPNVKGWQGGQDWLSSQEYTNRIQLIDFIVDGNTRFKKSLAKRLEKFDVGTLEFYPVIKIKNSKSAASIIRELTDRMIFETNDEMLANLNQLLKYDFNPRSENANQSILNVYQYLAKSPEFQII